MYKLFIPLVLLSTTIMQLPAQSVAINTDATVAHPSAVLDVKSTNKGFLPPRMTMAQRDAIAKPSPGLIIYNTDSKSLDIFAGYGWGGINFTQPGVNRLIGGDSYESAKSIQQTTDGGYIIAGQTNASANGDVTGVNKGQTDWWIVKLTAMGTIAWNKLVGGSGLDDAHCIQQTTDGGYIISGTTSSSASGDITGTNHGLSDYWVVKLNSTGDIIWNKLLGGSGFEVSQSSIQQTTDGGYIFCGSSTSSVSGDVTGISNGEGDFWVVKLDASGNITWNKLLGGSGFEGSKSSIQQTTDGGYIFCGTSHSSESGDIKGVSNGEYDFWVVKLGASGNITWNKLLGGSVDELPYDIQQTTDGGYVVAGTTNYSVNGLATHGQQDYLIMKLNSLGVISWTKTFGGTGADIATGIQQTTDGGYIVVGSSESSANGDVSGTSHGGYDYWIIKLSSAGNIFWNKLLGGFHEEQAYSIKQTVDGGYIIAGISYSTESGDVRDINHHPNGLVSDNWIVKLDSNGNLTK